MNDNYIAVITGAAGGIGSRTAEILESRGVKCALLDVNEARLKERWGESSDDRLVVVADITSESDMDEAASQVVAHFGHVNAVIANAGHLAQAKTGLEGTTSDMWRKTMAINLDGAFNTAKAFLAPLKSATGHRAIVFTSSVLAIRGSGNMIAYSAAKAGLVGLMTGAAQDLGKNGITVNAVAPSLCRSEGGVFDSIVGDVEALESKVPLGRFGSPDDLGEAIAFLASPKASYVTGQLLTVDGGLTASAHWHPYWK